jgi:uncharacterized protein (TIGR02594 family)
VTLKTSLIITGDASVARKEVEALNASVDKLAGTAKATAAPVAQLDKAQQDAANSAAAAATAAAQLGDAQAKTAGSARDLTGSTDAAKAAQTGGATASRAAADAQRGYGEELAKAAGESRNLVAANDQVAASTAAVEKQLAAIETAQAAAAGGAGAHAAAAEGLQGEIKAMVAQIAGGATVFEAMAERGGSFATALGEVAQASVTAKSGITAAGDSGQKAAVDLGGLGDTVVDVAGKATGMGGALGSAAAILGGPWGAAIGIGINLLGGFAAGLIEGALESDKLASSSLSLVDALDKQKFATDAGREAIEAYNEQQDKARKSNELAHRDALRKAEDDIGEAIRTREKTKALLEQAAVEAGAAQQAATGAGVSVDAAEIYAPYLADLKAQIAAQNKEIATLQQTRRNKLIEVGRSNGEAAADPAKAIDLKYDLQRQQAEKAAASNTKLARTIDDTVAAIERRRIADKKAYDESQRRAAAVPKGAALGNQIEAGSAASILATAERYRGLSEKSGGDRAQLRDLFKQAGANVDPTMVAWCAAFVNSVLAANGVKGTGSLSARSFLGFGQATDSPNKGDVVVSKRGSGGQGHVGFYQGTDAKGRVLVLGGNSGDKVATQAVARSDVLGFRRAPSAADSYKDAQKAAGDAQKAAADAAEQQRRDLDQVIAKYLPATAAAKEYADELARIDTLAKSYDGKTATSGLTSEQATAARTALKAANEKRVAEINLTPEAKAADDARKSIDGVIASLGRELAARQALDPVQRAMAQHQDELARLNDAERATAEAKLRTLYQQDGAYRAVEEATRAAADAQRQFRDMALDAFDAIVLGGENAGKVIDRLAQTIASAAIEAAVLGTGPLAALLKGGGTAAPAAAAASNGAAQATADLVGKTVGKSVGDRLDGVFGKGNGGKALQNAGYGYTAASIVGGSGLAGGLGGTIGGEIAGKFLSKALGSFAGPFGAIAGGVLGGVVGKLFTSSKSGSATIGAVGGQAGITGTGGNNAALTKAASGLAGSVNDSIESIIDRLGGSLGSYAVSIGQRDKKFVVDESGRGSTKYGKANDGITAYATAEEAAAAALINAIKDGAVAGVSPAIAKAIQSSADVNKALAEAVKVQELELLIGGVNAQIDKAFRDFEAQAKDRVRIATTYGFDVVAIEKRNGEDRVKLAQQLATSQVGSLQKLIEEMTQGSLFEGSALDKITALNTAIDKAKADLAAGVDGAGDTLTDLYQKRLTASKEAYGTTSGFAADRTATLDEARAAVAATNARIVAAQAAKPVSDPALTTTNATLDEMSDQNARIIAALEANNALMARLGGSGGSATFNLARVAAV